MSSVTLNLVNVLATTLPKIVPKVTHDIMRAHPFLVHCIRSGAFTIEDGGSDIRCPVVLVDSTNTGSVGLYESFAVTPNDAPDTARYAGWPKYRFSWTLDQTEIDQNKGPQKVIDLADTKQTQALHTFLAGISADLMTDGTAFPTKRLKGLETFLEFATSADQTTAARTPGGISKATYTNWHNQYASMTAFGTDGLDAWNSVYRACSSQGLHNDIVITDDEVYAFYEKEMSPKQSLFDKELAAFGYQNLMFKEAPVVYDRDNLNGSGKTFFLTTSGKTVTGGISPDMFTVPGMNGLPKNKGNGFGFQLHFLKQKTGGMLRIDPPQKPVNQDAVVVNGYLNPLLSCSSIKRQGCTKFTGTVQY